MAVRNNNIIRDSGKTFMFSKIINSDKKKIYEQIPNSIQYFRFKQCGKLWKLFISINRWQNDTHIKKVSMNKHEKKI